MSEKQIISVHVLPRARRNALEQVAADAYRIHTTSAPSDGAANDAVIKMLAKHFGIAKGRITIIRGNTSRDKVIEIS